MPKKRPRSHRNDTYQTDPPVFNSDICLVPNDQDNAYQEEVYDIINEEEIEISDEGYEQIKDSCLRSCSFSKSDSLDPEVPQHLKSHNKEANGTHAKENDYINMLKVDL